MVDNTGNSYRTRQAVVVCTGIIAVAVTILLVGAFDVGLMVAAGVFLLIIGLMGAIISFSFSATPDKFGPSERNYRLFAGLFTAVIGAFLIMLGQDVELYISIAVLLIAIAVIGLCATFLGNKTSKY